MFFLHLLYIYALAMVPVIELRGAIPMGVSLGVPLRLTMLAAMLGNLTPVPFLILFTRPIFRWMREKSPFLQKLVARLEQKAVSKEKLLRRYELLGLCILVAIPLPGTGAWTGALVASVFNIRMKQAFPVIALGVLIAGILVSVITYGVAALM